MRVVLLLAMVMMLTLPTYRSALAQSELTVVTPAEDATVQGSSLTVNFQTNGFRIVTSPVPVEEAGKRPDANRAGEGHVHLMLDLQPVVIWQTPEPYTFANVAPGVHQLSVELVNNDHSPLSPPIVVQRRVTVQASAQAPANASAPAPAATVEQSAAPTHQGMLPATSVGSSFTLSEQRILMILAALQAINIGVYFRLKVVASRRKVPNASLKARW